MKKVFWLVVIFICYSQLINAQNTAQFRGLDRNGVFPESGLLKTWPETGPELLWSTGGIGGGYASVSVTGDAIYVTGKEGSNEVLTLLNLQGDILWKLPYGRAAVRSYSDSRCTPAVVGNMVYCISGRGDVVCIDSRVKKLKWSVPAFDQFEGIHWYWEIAEQPLIVDDKIVFTPGGHKTSMVALDRMTGETIWQTESLHDTTAMASPALIEIDGRKIIVNVMIKYVFGVDAEDGKILWKVLYSDINPPLDHPWKPHNNCVMPLYHNGQLFVTSGYDHVGVMFLLFDKGEKIEKIWVNSVLDNHHGQVVRLDNYIYGSNWIDNRNGNWCCLDWKTGTTYYETKWHNKGPISAADGMLYCYDEKGGNIALVKPDPEKFDVVSSFQTTQGKGPHWSQPVIHKGVMYIRHGDVLMAYDVKE